MRFSVCFNYKIYIFLQELYTNGQQIVSDGHGGGIIVWTDYRNGDYDIYAQRIDANGDTIENTRSGSLPSPGIGGDCT